MPLPSPLPVRVLDSTYVGRDQQNAIRPLDAVAVSTMLGIHGGVDALFQPERIRIPIEGGHVEALVRRRVGQQQFRRRLLDRLGPTCAVTGPQPETVLDAAHLHAYALRPEHRLDEAMLLRADVHRLFDRLLLTFDPRDWRAHVAPPLLERHAALRPLDGRLIELPPDLRPASAVIDAHHSAALSRWRELSHG